MKREVSDKIERTVSLSCFWNVGCLCASSVARQLLLVASGRISGCHRRSQGGAELASGALVVRLLEHRPSMRLVRTA